jgi:hypothetical protein
MDPGIQIKTGRLAKQVIPSDHARHLCTYHEADEATVANAIDGALAAKAEWEALPWNDRAAIFLRAAELVSGKYRYKLMAATMLGQGKNAWQAEIDAAAEVRRLRAVIVIAVSGWLRFCTIAIRFLPFRCEVCGRALCATATQKCTGVLEVSRPNIRHPVLL